MAKSKSDWAKERYTPRRRRQLTEEEKTKNRARYLAFMNRESDRPKVQRKSHPDIEDHYWQVEQMRVRGLLPEKQIDNTDYSLTTEEKAEIKAGFHQKIVEAIAEAKKLIKSPYQFNVHVIGFCSHPQHVFRLTNGDGDVIKESTSPWIVMNFYQSKVGL